MSISFPIVRKWRRFSSINRSAICFICIEICQEKCGELGQVLCFPAKWQPSVSDFAHAQELFFPWHGALQQLNAAQASSCCVANSDGVCLLQHAGSQPACRLRQHVTQAGALQEEIRAEVVHNVWIMLAMLAVLLLLNTRQNQNGTKALSTPRHHASCLAEVLHPGHSGSSSDQTSKNLQICRALGNIVFLGICATKTSCF